MFKRMALIATLLMIFSTATVANAGNSSKIEWNNDYDKALKLAKETGKPLMLDFWASWCGPCKAMDKEVWPDQKIVANSKKFICVSIDIELNPSTASLYRANSIPNIVFTDPWGTELTRNVGFMKANDLIRIMELVPADFSEIKELGAILAKDGKNLQALSGIASFYKNMGVPDASNKYYERALKTDAIKNSCEVREEVLIGMGLNYLKMKQFNEARKMFERHLKELPNGSQCDKAFLGLVTTQLYQGKYSEAEKSLEQMKARFPNSTATEQAAQNIEVLKKQK